MKAFDLYQPRTLEQALGSLTDGEKPKPFEKARILAGGQDLLTELKEHLAEPDEVVNLKHVPGLDSIDIEPEGEVHIGALVTITQLEEDDRVRERYSALHEAAGSIASPQIRSAGTVGGNLCQRPRCWYFRHEEAICLKKGGLECYAFTDNNKYNAIIGGGPSYIVHPSDLAPALVSLDARVVIAGPEGERSLPLESFFTLPADEDAELTRENVLAPNEIVTAVLVPPRPDEWRSTYLKFKERGSFDWALSAVALGLRVSEDKIQEARLCLGGVAPKPWRCTSTEELLVGRKLDEATFRAAAEDALVEADPLSENAYKVPLTKGLIIKALRKLASA